MLDGAASALWRASVTGAIGDNDMSIVQQAIQTSASQQWIAKERPETPQSSGLT